MPQPTSQDVHVNSILTQMSVAFMQENYAFVASKVFPQINVNKQSDSYFVYSQADFFRDQVQPRADGTESAGTGYSLSTATYSATNYALHKDTLFDPEKALSMMYYDTLVHDPTALDLLIKMVGIEKIMLGSDMPFPIGDHHPRVILDHMSLDKADRSKLETGVAQRLFGL